MRIDDLTLIRGNDSSRVRSELLRQVAVLTNQYLREEDIVAYLENYIFALLLPDVTGENAKALMEYLQTRIAWTPFESDVGIKFNLKGIVGITAYTHNGTSPDELVANANRALQLAEVDDDGRAYLMTMTNSSLDENHVS
jgi:GGDEF domain-containing protein